MEKENKYYVYVYLDPRKPGKYQYSGLDFSFLFEPFYVGKGKNFRDIQHLVESKRPSTLKRNLHKNNKINSIFKNGLEPIIIRVLENLSETDSLNFEIYIINKIGRSDIKTGPLSNHTNGGDGIIGYNFTSEVKTKMSEVQKNNINHATRGKKLSEEHKTKISNSITGVNNPMYGKTSKNKGKNMEEIYGINKANKIKDNMKKSHEGKVFSEITKNKMSLSRIGKKLTGNFNGQPKTFKFINPSEKEFIVTGKFNKFCKENNLPIHTFKRIVNNNRKNKYWNGWTVISI